MSELKPCPFCGGEAKLYSGRIKYVFCKECFATNEDVKTESEAIEAWNTRHERTCRAVKRRGDYVCSACGEVLLSGWADPFEAIPLECFKYCFNCGARVATE